MWCDTTAVNLNHRVTGGSTVHSINIEIRATGAVSPEISTSAFVISLHNDRNLRFRHTFRELPVDFRCCWTLRRFKNVSLTLCDSDRACDRIVSV